MILEKPKSIPMGRKEILLIVFTYALMIGMMFTIGITLAEGGLLTLGLCFCFVMIALVLHFFSPREIVLREEMFQPLVLYPPKADIPWEIRLRKEASGVDTITIGRPTMPIADFVFAVDLRQDISVDLTFMNVASLESRAGQWVLTVPRNWTSL